jgi:hypothetical protein
MEFKDLRNMSAEELEAGLVIEIINKAYDKAHKIIEEAYEIADYSDIPFEMTQNLLLSRMFEHLMNTSEIIGDLSDCITVGAFDHLVKATGLTEEEVVEMDDDDIEEIIKPYITLQHKYAGFNNEEIRNMLFEIAKNLLTPLELMSIYLGY